MPAERTERKSTMTDTQTSTRATTANKNASKGFTDAEKAAMRARARELKAQERAGADREAGERDLLANVAAMPDSDRIMAERIHEIVTTNAPELAPRTWYGMPAYARDGKLVCFFKSADKFKSRYATFGFEESAKLDDGAMWPVAFALTKLTPADEARIAALVKKAVS